MNGSLHIVQNYILAEVGIPSPEIQLAQLKKVARYYSHLFGSLGVLSRHLLDRIKDEAIRV